MILFYELKKKNQLTKFQIVQPVVQTSWRTSFSFHLISVYENMTSLSAETQYPDPDSWTSKVFMDGMRSTRKNCVREQNTTKKGFASHGCKANDYLWSNVFGENMRLCEEDNIGKPCQTKLDSWKRLVQGLTISGEKLFFLSKLLLLDVYLDWEK